jgi:multidrug resistance efflux pump
MSIKYKGILIALPVVLLTAAAFYYLGGSFKSVPVKVEPVKRDRLLITVSATSTGTIKSDNEARLSSERTGRIIRLGAEEGDAVKAGQALAELESRDSSIDVRRAESAFQGAQSRLREAVESYAPYKSELESSLKKAAAVLTETRQQLERQKDLLSKGYVSKEQYEAVVRQFDVASAQHESATAAMKNLSAKESAILGLKMSVEEAGQSLTLARLQQSRSFITSPIDGIVTGRKVEIGDTAAPGKPLFSVVSLESLYVETTVDEADVSKVQTGQDASITMDAYADKTFSGKVYLISPVVLGERLEARTFRVRTRLTDRVAVLKPGMSADVEIITDRVEKALLVPSQAVTERGGKRYVYRLAGSRAALVEVSTGLSNWTFTEIKQGLKEGDKVITSMDAPGLADGARVSVEKK